MKSNENLQDEYFEAWNNWKQLGQTQITLKVLLAKTVLSVIDKTKYRLEKKIKLLRNVLQLRF